MLTYQWWAPAPLHPQSFSAAAAELEYLLHFSRQSCCHPLICHKQGSSELHKRSSGLPAPCGLEGPPNVWFLPVDTPGDNVKFQRIFFQCTFFGKWNHTFINENPTNTPYINIIATKQRSFANVMPLNGHRGIIIALVFYRTWNTLRYVDIWQLKTKKTILYIWWLGLLILPSYQNRHYSVNGQTWPSKSERVPLCCLFLFMRIWLPYDTQ